MTIGKGGWAFWLGGCGTAVAAISAVLLVAVFLRPPDDIESAVIVAEFAFAGLLTGIVIMVISFVAFVGHKTRHKEGNDAESGGASYLPL